MRYEIGTKVFGDWEIVAELGEGSFGKVFRLEKNTYKVKASSALKVLTVPRTPAEVEDAIAEGYDERSVTEQFHEVVERLVDEIAVMAELKSHPNIVSVEDYTVIQHQGTIGWDILIRMELLTPLQAHQCKMPMDEAAIRKLARDICEALVFCQSKKLIHRDIKPGNVFVDSMGHFKLGDFGVARTAEKTISNMSKQGTENYMAPEVYYGREYGANVDIYSLGMMLYRLMNKNRLPFYPLPPAFPKFSEKEDALLRRLRGEILPAPCDASRDFAAIILKACEADPRKRYQTAAEMLADLSDPGSLRRSFTPLEIEEDAFEEDSWEETAGTVGVFSGKDNKKSNIKSNKRESIRNEKGVSKTSGGLEQYILQDVSESNGKKIDHWNDWHEDSTDEMRDHTMHQSLEVEEDEDVTISVFGGKSNACKDTAAKKTTDKKTADKKTVDKKPADQKLTDKKTDDKKNTGERSLAQYELKANVTSRSLSELNLTVRTYNILKRAGIVTIEQLCNLTLADIRTIDGVGPSTREEILTALGAQGLQLSTGKSQKQLWKENKHQHILDYWKVNLPRILRESEMISFEKGKQPANKLYFAPDIPENIWTEAIFHMTEKHVTRFGQVLTITDDKLRSEKSKDVLGVVDLSLEKESPCSRGILVTTDAIYLHLGGVGRETVHPVMIPYKDFSSGWTLEGGGLLKAKHPVLMWTSRQHGACRYDSGYGNFVDYNILLECLKELSKKEK